MEKTVLNLVEKGKGVNVPETAAIIKAPLGVVKSYLVGLEKKGFLARDDTVRGLYFYANKFKL